MALADFRVTDFGLSELAWSWHGDTAPAKSTTTVDPVPEETDATVVVTQEVKATDAAADESGDEALLTTTTIVEEVKPDVDDAASTTAPVASSTKHARDEESDDELVLSELSKGGKKSKPDLVPQPAEPAPDEPPSEPTQPNGDAASETPRAPSASPSIVQRPATATRAGGAEQCRLRIYFASVVTDPSTAPPASPSNTRKRARSSKSPSVAPSEAPSNATAEPTPVPAAADSADAAAGNTSVDMVGSPPAEEAAPSVKVEETADEPSESKLVVDAAPAKPTPTEDRITLTYAQSVRAAACTCLTVAATREDWSSTAMRSTRSS